MRLIVKPALKSRRRKVRKTVKPKSTPERMRKRA